MIIFLTLLAKLIPLYLIILLGYIAGKYLRVKKESVSPILIYIIAPIIIFNGVVTVKLDANTLSLPVLFFALASIICFLFLKLSKNIFKDSTRNILAFTSGVGNVGYFGLPVAMILFDQKTVSMVVLSILGFILYENTVGFYVVAKGNLTPKDSLLKVLKLPTIYAFLIGILVNLLGINLGSVYADAVINFRGAYTILGMMIIGLGLVNIKEYKTDWKFLSLSFLAKFFVWPLIILAVILVDRNFVGFYNQEIYKVMILMAIVPLAANTVAVATELKVQPEKASVTVLLSTFFALFYIPLIVAVFF